MLTPTATLEYTNLRPYSEPWASEAVAGMQSAAVDAREEEDDEAEWLCERGAVQLSSILFSRLIQLPRQLLLSLFSLSVGGPQTNWLTE